MNDFAQRRSNSGTDAQTQKYVLKKYWLWPISAAPYTAFGSLSPAPLRGHHTVEFNRKYSKNGSEFH